MRLTDYIISPAVVMDIHDPEMQGRIKCMIPGIFDPLSPAEALPWIYPFMMNKYQNFSMPKQGTKVWVLKNKTNEDEYTYVNMFEFIDCTKTLVTERYENDLEILMSRKTLDDCAQIYYDDVDGIVLKVNDNRLQLFPNGEVYLGDGNSILSFTGGHAYLGSGNADWQPMVLGDSLQQYFKKLSEQFKNLADKSTGDQTTPLKPHFQQISSQLKDCSELLSKNTSVN